MQQRQTDFPLSLGTATVVPTEAVIVSMGYLQIFIMKRGQVIKSITSDVLSSNLNLPTVSGAYLGRLNKSVDAVTVVPAGTPRIATVERSFERFRKNSFSRLHFKM